jgi:hypothetical protein
MKMNAFDARNTIRAHVNNWPVEDRPKDDSVFFGFDTENEQVLKIEVSDREPIPADVTPGYLFRVDFDAVGLTFEIVLIS